MIAAALTLLALAAPLGRTQPIVPPTAAVVSAAVSIEFKVPKNDGWVTDLANQLSDNEEKSLEARLEEWKRRTGHQLAVLTVPSLDGTPIEQASIAVANQWGIGTDAREDGALLLLARDDRELRIEVGSGLEGALTDSISGRIIRDVIVPRFRAGQFAPGIRAGVEAIISVVEQGAESVPGLVQQRSGRTPRTGLIMALFVIAILLSRIRRKRRGGPFSNWRGGGPLIIPSIFGSGGGGGFSSGGGGGGFSGFGGGGFSGGGASGKW